MCYVDPDSFRSLDGTKNLQIISLRKKYISISAINSSIQNLINYTNKAINNFENEDSELIWNYLIINFRRLCNSGDLKTKVDLNPDKKCI